MIQSDVGGVGGSSRCARHARRPRADAGWSPSWRARRSRRSRCSQPGSLGRKPCGRGCGCGFGMVESADCGGRCARTLRQRWLGARHTLPARRGASKAKAGGCAAGLLVRLKGSRMLGVDALEGWSASMHMGRSRSRAQMTPPTQAARGPRFGKDQGSAGARAE
jgi:hypothetical protein